MLKWLKIKYNIALLQSPFLDNVFGDRWWWIRKAAVQALGTLGDTQAIAPLTKVLGDKNRYFREDAVEALGLIGDPRAIDHLIKALGDKDWWKSQYRQEDIDKTLDTIMTAFGKLDAVEYLILILGDEDWVVRRSAAKALGTLGNTHAVDPLTKSLGDKYWSVREEAAKALGILGDLHAVDSLTKALNDDVWSVRQVATEALGKLGDFRNVESLTKMLSDQYEDVRKKAVNALSKLGVSKWSNIINGNADDFNRIAASNEPEAFDILIKALSVYHKYGYLNHERKAAAKALGILGDIRAIVPLKLLLGHRDDDLSKAAEEALGKLGVAGGSKVITGDVEILIKALGDEDNIGVIEALGKLGDSRAVDPLILVLRDGLHSDVRYAVAKALGKLGSSRAIKPLTMLLGDEGYVRTAAAEALGKLGVTKWNKIITNDDEEYVKRLAESIQPDAVDFNILISLLRSANVEANIATIETLGKFGNSRAVQPLIKMLGSSNIKVRESATEAIIKLGDQHAIEPLLNMLSDKDQNVREAAANILAKLKNPRTVEHLLTMLNNSHEMEILAIKTLGKHGDIRAVEPLIKMLRDNNQDVCITATEALGRLKDARAVKPLIKQLKRALHTLKFYDKGNNEASQIASKAAAALGEIKDARAVKPLIKALNNKHDYYGYSFTCEVIDAAAEALGKLGDPRAIKPLTKALSHRDYSKVAAALGKMGDSRAVNPLINKVLDIDKDSWFDSSFYTTVVETLGILGDSRAVDPLIKQLNNNNSNFRKSVVDALGRLGVIKWSNIIKGDNDDYNRIAVSNEPEAFDILIKAFGNKNYFAAKALGILGDTRAISPLVMELNAKDRYFRKTVAEVIISFSKNDPHILTNEIKKIIQTPHSDYKSDYGQYDHCGFPEGTTHTDSGIGIKLSDF